MPAERSRLSRACPPADLDDVLRSGADVYSRAEDRFFGLSLSAQGVAELAEALERQRSQTLDLERLVRELTCGSRAPRCPCAH